MNNIEKIFNFENFKSFLKQNTSNQNTKLLNSGAVSLKDRISPSYVNFTNPKYVEIDDNYYSGLLVIDYSREYGDIILKNLINSNLNVNVSMFYEKQDTYKTIKELTYAIGNTGVDLKFGNENKEDIDLAAFSYNDAKYIRKEIQINNEDLYYVYIYCEVIASSEKELKTNLAKVEGILQSSGLIPKRANFRQQQLFNACLPIMDNDKELKEVAKRNILTQGLVGTYPFISSTLCDEKGVFLGSNIYNNSMILVDRFDKNKYKNANMCVFGTSGAGKSFYIKLLILRYRILGIEQYVIDPEREYNKIAESVGGTLIKLGPNSDTFINVFDIREESIEDGNGYLSSKLLKLRGFFNLILGDLNEEKTAILEEKLIEMYAQKGITFDDETLYKKSEEGKVNVIREFKTSEDMPIMEDLYNILDDEKDKIFKLKLYPFVYGSLKFFNHHTTVSFENKLVIADIYDLGEENLKYGIYMLTDIFWDRMKRDRNQNKAIYLDEIWRLIGATSNQFVASFIYKIFKTIRKFGGSAVAITQDVSDLFGLENGTYGKAILNNCSIKSFFSLEEENIIVLEKYANISEKERIEIKSLKRGESLMFIGDDHILARVEASEYEKNLII